jgi:hypothetical protein
MPWWQAMKIHSVSSQWAPSLVFPWLVLAVFLGWQLRLAMEKKTSSTMEGEPA